MKGIRKRAIIVMVALLIGIMCIKPASAEKTATFSASCYMPFYVEMPNGEMVLADSKITKQDTNITESQKIEETNIIENKTEFIQQEEITLENDEEVELIKTVCAK